MQGRAFTRMNPPHHTAQRKPVAPVAAPNNLASYATGIRERTHTVFDALPREAICDWWTRCRSNSPP
jgi:cytochrome P450